jgi:biopolymer transport protein TolR
MRLENLSKRSFRNRIKSEINLTPFIDIMLVLLIVFMLTASATHTVLNIELPKFKGDVVEGNKDNISIRITKNNQVFLWKEKLLKEELILRINSLIKLQPNLEVMLHADKNVIYETVMEVFVALRRTGIQNITLVMEQT